MIQGIVVGYNAIEVSIHRAESVLLENGEEKGKNLRDCSWIQYDEMQED